MTDIDPISQAIGRIEEGTKNLNEKFDTLPCGEREKRINKVEDYQNKQMGVVAVIMLLFGFIGWLMSPLISWLLDRIK